MKTTLSEASPLLDEAALDRIRALEKPDRPSILGKMIDVYLNNTSSQLQALRETIAGRDPVAMHKVAHSLKSSSATLGALALGSLFRDLEEKGRENSIDGAETILLEIEEQFQLVEAALRGLL